MTTRRRLVDARPLVPNGQGVSLREACARTGISYGYGRRLVAAGRFPIPALPRLGRRGRHRYSTVDIDRYLNTASLEDVLHA